jgi:hypothetical protein
MSNLWKRYNGWRSRRQQLSLERWAQERGKGKGQYVLRQAFSFVVIMSASRDVLDHFFFRPNHEFGLWFYIVVYSFTGIFCGSKGWEKLEAQYQDAQRKRRLQTPLDDRILPR